MSSMAAKKKLHCHLRPIRIAARICTKKSDKTICGRSSEDLPVVVVAKRGDDRRVLSKWQPALKPTATLTRGHQACAAKVLIVDTRFGVSSMFLEGETGASEDDGAMLPEEGD